MNNIFEINQLVELEVPEGNEYEGKYSSRIEDINKDGIYLAMPTFQSKPILLSPGSKVVVWYVNSSAAYECECQVLARNKEPIPVLLVSQPIKINKIQRRKFFRIDAKLPFKLAIINDNQKEITENVKFNDLITSDISGGGLSFNGNFVDLVNGKKVFIEIMLSNEEVSTFGKVVWIKKNKCVENDCKNLIGIEFTHIIEKNRDKIIQWIFSRQMELRRKGLI